MTLGWHTNMDGSPSLLGLMISGGNHSHRMIRESRECVINLPTTALTDTVIGIGNTSGAEIDKFDKFNLTAEDASKVDAPLIGECHASFECRLHAADRKSVVEGQRVSVRVKFGGRRSMKKK